MNINSFTMQNFRILAIKEKITAASSLQGLPIQMRTSPGGFVILPGADYAVLLRRVVWLFAHTLIGRSCSRKCQHSFGWL